MSQTTPVTGDHDVPAGAPALIAPATSPEPAARLSAAEQARTLVAVGRAGSLATLSEDGSPWASLVAYGALDDGRPIVFVSRLAEHGRNLERDPRASLVVAATPSGDDVLAAGRVTLAGVAERPDGELAEAALARYLAAVPTARAYAEFRDFTLWVLRVERVRWVGGYGRMASAAGAGVRGRGARRRRAGGGAGAIAHLNADHADALLAMARALGGYPDATAATCHAIDRLGLDLFVTAPGGYGMVRLGFAEPVTEPHGLRAATVELARRARAS